MTTYKPYHLLFLAAIVSFAISACKKTDSNHGSVQINQPPITAAYGDTIAVTGSNIPIESGSLKITLNDQTFQIIQQTATTVKVIVPKMVGSGYITVAVGGKSYFGPNLTYKYKTIVTTIAGSGGTGYNDGIGSAATFRCPWGIVKDDNGYLYVADCYNRLIRKISPTGEVTTINIPNNVNFYSPQDIALDRATHTLYVTDYNAHLLKINSDNSMSVIFDDEVNTATSGIGVGPDGYLYVSNNLTGTIIKLTTDGTVIKKYPGMIWTPRNIIFDKANNMYVAGYDLTKGQAAIFQFLPGGTTKVIYDDPDFKGWQIAVDDKGNFYEADHVNNAIKIIDKLGIITTIAGSGEAKDIDGTGLNAAFNGPQGLTIDADGTLYVSTFNYDTGQGNKIRKIVIQ